MIQVHKKKIKEIVSENYLYASILYFFGIEFYNFPEATLEQACKEKGVSLDYVITRLEEAVATERPDQISLTDFPVDLLIEYLKHAHHFFVKQKLPYIARCIDKLEYTSAENSFLIKDLKFIFPLFIEDFIKHIYEEEDTLFSYILSLHKVIKGELACNKVYFQMEKYTIHDFAIEHDQEDEMEGMRIITNNYKSDFCEDLCLKVVLSELKAFDEELRTHAKIEDHILFPKALLLEREVKNKIQKNIPIN